MIKTNKKAIGKSWETKKRPEKAIFQNIQLITCKNNLAEPLFMRVSEGYVEMRVIWIRILTLVFIQHTVVVVDV